MNSRSIPVSGLRTALLGLLATALVACGGPAHTDAMSDGSPMDAMIDASLDGPPRDVMDVVSTVCTGDLQCTDGVYCNGAERCMPGAVGADARGCLAASPATPCLTGQMCDEAQQRCMTQCAHALDADGDGHRASDCGGDDCDDSDANRFPGNPEVCDVANRDEDCDPITFGFRDIDMDAFIDARCCNMATGGAMNCGDDCNDSRANVHPGLAEVCDGLDNDCNTMIDEGVQRQFLPDTDHDNFGAASGATMSGCVPPAGYAEATGDCDDTNSAVHPGALEQCDAAMVDEDCNGVSNPSALCNCSGDISRMCAQPGACAMGSQRCIGGAWGACSIIAIAEVCNGVDDDCDGTVDQGLSVTCYPDRDNDGYAEAGAASVRSCPVPGRDGFAGCPPNQTNRPALGVDIDCNDTDSTVSPGQPELCDSTMRDENCDGVINPAALCMCVEGGSRPCVAPGTCGAGNQTCSGGHWSSCSVNPVAESCNGIDDDCDGMTDEGLTVTCYADSDNDGYAATGAPALASCPVAGRGGVGGCPTNQTNREPTGASVDCNDVLAAISPGAIEVCDAPLVDEDCDGTANPAGLCACSGSASRACLLPGACAAGTQTCVAGSWGNCSITPQTESCNAIDDNCDGTVDEGLRVTCYADVDGDGYAATGAAAFQSCPVSGREALGGCPTNQTNRPPTAPNVDCNDTSSSINPPAAELCDAPMVDENCDGIANPSSLCACSGTATRTCTLPGACAAGSQTCTSGAWGSCSVLPVAEVCNGSDDNCNGSTDEGLTVTCFADADNDGYAATGATPIQSCPAAGRAAVGGCPTNQTNRVPTVGNADCNDTNSSVNPGAAEQCDTAALDEDCDGTANPMSLCACTGTATRSCSTAGLVGPCAAGTQACSSGAWGTCSIQPVTETCNGVDDDCDGTTDESLRVTCYADADNDGYAATGTVSAPQCPDTTRPSVGGCPVSYTNRAPSGTAIDCTDTNSARNPGATEVCNAIDDDCDGMTDEGLTVTCYADGDNDTYAASGAAALQSCPQTGRDTVGGCPSNQTNRAPAAGAIDCADTVLARNPGVLEVCDLAMVDENCDGTANPPALCACSGSPSRSCTLAGLQGPCAAGTQTCASGSWGLCSIQPVAEVCNGADDDCDGVTDEGLTVTCYADADNDGYAASGAPASSQCPEPSRPSVGSCPVSYTNRAPAAGAIDCLDTNSARYPTAVEACNGVDDDCDGMTDEGLTVTCYADNDNDTYAAMIAAAVQSCVVTGRSAVGGCPNNQTNRAPAAGAIDCADSDPLRNPAATEVCDGTMLDENCDGTANPAALCACSGSTSRSCTMAGLSGPCAAGTQTCVSGAWGLCSIQPVAESCNNIDDDCDGTTDEGLRVTCYADADNDGYALSGAVASQQCQDSTRTLYGGCPTAYTNRAPAAGAIDCLDTDPARNPAAMEVCDTVDNDCDGATDESLTITCYVDQDNDGYAGAAAPPVAQCPVAGRAFVGGCATGWTNRAPGAGTTDCATLDSTRNPGETEVCNAIDDNCSGTTDEGVTQTFWPDADNDGFGAPSGTSVQGCFRPNGYAANNMDCDDTQRDRNPGQTEICDGLDNDCDNLLDGPGEDDDNDGHADNACAGTRGTDCNDTDVTVYNGATEICDRKDNNCSTSGSNGIDLAEDSDGDGHSPTAAMCTGGYPRNDCDDTAASVYPGATEGCDGRDNDCNAIVDDPPTADPACAAPSTTSACRSGACVTLACAPGHADCNGTHSDGCETDTANSATDCGGCGIDCGIGGACLAGRCDTVLQVVTGTTHTCVRRESGRVACWGDNANGRLGDGTTVSRPTATLVVGITDAVEIAAGGNFTCARRATGAVGCWGNNQSGQLGDGTTANHSTAALVTGLTNAVEITAGLLHACARRADGTVVCWGSNATYQIGDGTTTQRTLPTAVIGLSGALDIDAGDGHTCARLAGSVMCWGANNVGQLGDGTVAARTTAVTATGLIDASALAAGGNHTCALRTGGSVMCWGANPQGEIGDGTTVQRRVPTAVLGVTSAAGVAAGSNHSCAWLADGTITCWGRNADGDLGDGTIVSQVQPLTSVTGINDAVEVASFDHHTCARRANGRVMCWGLGTLTQLGDGLNLTRTTPVTPLDTVNLSVTQTATGTSWSCARLAIGTAYCWGDNTYGQLGDGTTTSRTAPAVVRTATGPLTDIVELAGGGSHTCARLTSGQLRCWGINSSGQLGDGTVTTALFPVTVTGIADAAQLAAGSTHTCVRRTSGALACWGSNLFGGLGDGTATDRLTATAVSTVTDAIDLRAGGNYNCARRASGTTWCWGSNASGQIGDGTFIDRAVPTRAGSGIDNLALAVGNNHACVVRATPGSTVQCWGDNTNSRLGDGTSNNRSSPVTAIGVTSAVDLSLGAPFSCARASTGAVMCWGRNAAGQLADGTTVNRSTAVLSLATVTSMDAFANHTCGLDLSNTPVCWGGNGSGQLGDGTILTRTAPTAVIGLP